MRSAMLTSLATARCVAHRKTATVHATTTRSQIEYEITNAKSGKWAKFGGAAYKSSTSSFEQRRSDVC